jgi:TonB family protein
MLLPSVVLAGFLGQAAAPPPPITDCAAALARSSSTATAQICLGEEQFVVGQSAPKNSPEWRRRLEASAGFYQRAAALTADEVIKTTIFERLLVLFDQPLLNDPREMESAFLALMALKPAEVEPRLRFARFQEQHGAVDAAEETLLSARRLQPGELEPLRMLAQFYARRAGALHSQTEKDKAPVAATPPGEPDTNGVFQVGGALPPPRRTGNVVYPPEAQVAGVEGVVVAEITVNEAGAVTAARVLRSNPVLDEAALSAVREWRYDPTIVNGQPVPVKMTVTVNFTLPKGR